MTILLSQAVRVGGTVLAAGTTQTLAADIEADLVHRKMATYTSDPATALNDVPVKANVNPLTGKIQTIAKLTQAQYDAIAVKDDSTLYVIVA